MKAKVKTENRDARRRRVRSKISGTKEMPRFSVFKSNTRIVAQLIDDEKGETLVAATTAEAKGKTNVERIKETGALLATRAKEKNISKVVFDRGGFTYIGNIKLIADSARSAGLKF